MRIYIVTRIAPDSDFDIEAVFCKKEDAVKWIESEKIHRQLNNAAHYEIVMKHLRGEE